MSENTAQISVEHLREIFDQFDRNQNGIIEMWRMRELLDAANLHPTDVELFNLINEIDVNGDGMLSFQDFLLFVGKYKESTIIKDADMELLSSWIQLGGNVDKSGVIAVKKIKAIIEKQGFIINFDKLLSLLIQKQNMMNINSKKIAIPEEIGFDDFRQLMNDQI